MFWILGPLAMGLWDLITGEIPDYVTIPGLIVAIMYGLLFDHIALIATVVFLVMGYFMYRYGLVGGGDVLLIGSLTPITTALMPWGIASPFAVLFFSIALTTSFYGLFLKGRENPLYLLPLALLPPILWLLYGSLLMALIGKKPFIKEVSIEELEKEDILAEPIKGFEKMVIEEGDMEKLYNIGVKRVKVLRNLPKMGPFIALSLVLLQPPVIYFLPHLGLGLYLLFL